MYNIYTIKKVTPTRKFKLNDDILYQPNGIHRIDNWHSKTIEPVTIKVIELRLRRKMLLRISNTNFKTLNTAALKDICNAIEKTEDKNGK